MRGEESEIDLLDRALLHEGDPQSTCPWRRENAPLHSSSSMIEEAEGDLPSIHALAFAYGLSSLSVRIGAES